MTLTERDIPVLVDTLKAVMDIKIVPASDHCLYDHFVEYQRASGVLLDLSRMSNKVFQLARFGHQLEAFRKYWSEPKVLLHLRRRMLDKRQSTVLGALFEFQAAFHFRFMHKEVSWLPNRKNESEFDLRILTRSGQRVLIECTRKQPKDQRTADPELLINDIDSSVKSKLDKEAFDHSRAWVCVLLPEDIHWKEWPYCDELRERMKALFAVERGKNLLGVSVVSYRNPTIRVVGNDLTIREDDDPVWSLGNDGALEHIPADFHPGLPTTR